MNKKLSIIIAHFNPLDLRVENPLLNTLKVIEKENIRDNFEVIIADDGSDYTRGIIQKHTKKIDLLNDERNIFILEQDRLKEFLKNIGIKSQIITKWVYLPKVKKCMSKARVVNYASKITQSENLFFIDDDNYFISDDSISNIISLFNKYQFIVGQIKDNNGKLRKFSSKRVQGTTIGIKKDIFTKINGFGEWTEKFSCGVDSDFWIKVYNYFLNNKNLSACFTDKVSTYDSFSKRWKVYTKYFQDLKLKKEFNKIYGCKNYKSYHYNFSRNKNLWIENLIV